MDLKGAITPEEVSSWVASAEPGEAKVYAWGDDFPRYAPGVVAAKRQHAAGLVTFTSRRSPGRREYIMQRLARRTAEEAKVDRRCQPKCEDPEVAVLRLLRVAAAHSRPCPTDEALAHGAKLPDVDAASAAVARLREKRKIRVAFVGRQKRRQIQIVASGACTAMARL